MSKNIAVDGTNLVVRATPVVAIQTAPPSIIMPIGGTPGIPPLCFDFGNGDAKLTESDKVKASDDPVLVDKITEKLMSTPASGGTVADFGCQVVGNLVTTWTNRGTYQIAATATKTKAGGKAVIREDDATTVPCSCAGSYVAGSTTVPCSGSCNIKIQTAGQSKAKAL
jgi:hypothetical protein